MSQKFTEASRINSLFCLCLIPKLSKSMAQPDCCCRLIQAEKNGIVASGCVCGDRRASMKLSWSFVCLSPFPALHTFRSGSTWTNFQTQCNLWKWKKTPVSYKLSAASRISSLFLSLSDSQALQINGATGLLLQVDTGSDKWHCG